MVLAVVLGSAAGGGFPQWNSNAPACRRARRGDPAARVRSQASLAVSSNDKDWVVLNASPDLRLQIEATAHLHPRAGLQDPGLSEESDSLGLDVAHVQYYGWALTNRAALLPNRQQLDTATATGDPATPTPLAHCPPTTGCSPGRTARLNKRRPISSTASIPARRRNCSSRCASRLARSEPGSAHHRHWRLASAWARRSSSMTALIWGGSRNRPTRPPTPPPACRLSAVSACS